MKATLIPALLTAIFSGLFPALSRAESVIVQWEKIYNGPGADRPSLVALDSAGNVIVTGSSYDSHDERGNADIYTAKYAAADGTLLWDRRFDGPHKDYDAPLALAVDRAGNVIVTGITFTNTYSDGYTAKYAATNGALLWEKRYNGPVNLFDDLKAVTLDSADNVIVTGRAATFVGEGGWGDDFYTAKYAAADGALLWEKIYRPSETPQEDDRAVRVAVDSGDNVIVAGYTQGGSVESITVVKYAAANGALLWSVRREDITGITLLSADSADNVIVIGSGVTQGIHTAKYAAANGALLWDKRYKPTGQGTLFHPAVKVDGDGNVVVTVIEGEGNYVPLIVTLNTVKYAGTDGLLISHNQNHYRVPGQPFDIELDGAGNAFVTGYFDSSNGINNYDIYTAKYATGSGALVWEMRYNGAGNLMDFGDRLVVDGSGSVIVVGRTNTAGGVNGSDFYTAKYAPVDLDLDDDGLLDSWEIAHFGNTAAHSALDDTDGDGAVELLELAFGSDPKSPTSVPAPAVIVEGGYLTTTIAKQPGVIYVVQTSATPEAGFSHTSTTVLTDTTSTFKVRDNIAIGAQSRRFLRVQVVANP